MTTRTYNYSESLRDGLVKFLEEVTTRPVTMTPHEISQQVSDAARLLAIIDAQEALEGGITYRWGVA